LRIRSTSRVGDGDEEEVFRVEPLLYTTEVVKLPESTSEGCIRTPDLPEGIKLLVLSESC